MSNKRLLGVVSLIFLLILSACGTNDSESTNESNTNGTNNAVESGTDVTNEENENTGEDVNNTQNQNGEENVPLAREVPKNMKAAGDAKFNIGDEVTINAEHEAGMMGAPGTILGAYETIVYSVSYQPTNDDYPEENHKWVVQEEIKGIDEEMLVPGTEVIIEADYEEGMFGAEVEIDTAEKTTVYMVSFTLDSGVMKQKWFKESELEAR